MGAGFYVNINEISGKYSSIVFAISNTIATLPGVITPYIAGEKLNLGMFDHILFNKKFLNLDSFFFKVF